MVRKQCTWRGDEALFSILLLLSITCFAADNEPFYGESKRVLESAYKLAPPEVHLMVDSLLGRVKKRPYRRNYAIFDGEPGVGKSTLAVAMAYKLGWDVQEFGVSDFLKSESRGGTSAEFNRLMSEFEQSNDNNFIIINEFNQLLTNYKSKKHDTDSSSKSFWLFLDHLKKKKNLFFVGTTNGIGGFSPQVQDRFKGAIVTITAPKDLSMIKESLFEHLQHEDIVPCPEVQCYIESNLEILKGYTLRDIISLVDILKMQILKLTPDEYQADRVTLNMNHLQAALHECADLEARFQEDPYEQTDSERQERHHAEILSHNRQALSQSNWQFNVNTALSSASMLINIVGILTSFRSAQDSYDLQRVALQMQQVFHNNSIEVQERLHSQSAQQQQDFHQQNRDAHEQIVRMQERFNREHADTQRAMHSESNGWTSWQALGWVTNIIGLATHFIR